MIIKQEEGSDRLSLNGFLCHSQGGGNDWIRVDHMASTCPAPHQWSSRERAQREDNGRREKGDTSGETPFTPRSPTAASWQTCGSLGRWTLPRAAGKGAASPWRPGRSPSVAGRRPDPVAGLKSQVPRSPESTGALCRSAAGTAWWGRGWGNAPGKPGGEEGGG